MYYSFKLKPDSSITGYIPAIVCLCICVLAGIIFGVRMGFIVFSVFFAAYACFSFLIFLKTKNLSYFVASLWQLLFGIHTASRPLVNLFSFGDKRFEGLFYFCLISVTIWLFYLYFQRKAKWKGREVFELASKSVETTLNGFTERPHYSGKAGYSAGQLKEFAGFLKKNLIAMPFYEEKQVVLVPVKMSDEFSFIFNPFNFRMNHTWIAFDFDGNVSVSISKKDYLDYREELTFDQLCSNLGMLFIEFLEYFKKGEAEKIVDKLDELKVKITS